MVGGKHNTFFPAGMLSGMSHNTNMANRYLTHP